MHPISATILFLLLVVAEAERTVDVSGPLVPCCTPRMPPNPPNCSIRVQSDKVWPGYCKSIGNDGKRICSAHSRFRRLQEEFNPACPALKHNETESATKCYARDTEGTMTRTTCTPIPGNDTTSLHECIFVNPYTHEQDSSQSLLSCPDAYEDRMDCKVKVLKKIRQVRRYGFCGTYRDTVACYVHNEHTNTTSTNRNNQKCNKLPANQIKDTKNSPDRAYEIAYEFFQSKQSQCSYGVTNLRYVDVNGKCYAKRCEYEDKYGVKTEPNHEACAAVISCANLPNKPYCD